MPIPHSAIDNPHSLPCRKQLWAGVDEGARHNTAFQLSIDLKRDGLPGQIAFAALKDWNTHNRPPLDIRQLGEAVKGAYSGDYKGLGCERKPMADMCEKSCPVRRRVESRKLKVESPGGKAAERPEETAPGAPSPLRGGLGRGREEPENLPLAPSYEEGECAVPPDDGQIENHKSEIENVPLPVVDVADVAAESYEAPQWLVEGLVPERGVTMFTGEGGIGKSFVVLDLALAVAEGGQFLGHFECKQGRVLVVDLENERKLYGMRAKKVARGRGVTLDSLRPNLKMVDRDAAAFEIVVDRVQGRDGLESAISGYRPQLVIIDPMIAIHGSDENSNSQMRAVMMTLDAISQKHGTAVVLVHHLRKRNEFSDAGQRMRGASDIRNAVVSHVGLFRKTSRSMGSAKGPGSVVTAEHDKSRVAESLPPFEIEITDSEDKSAVYIRWRGEAEQRPSAATKSDEARTVILNLLEEQGACGRKELVEHGRAAGFAETTVQRALYALQAEGAIAKAGYGRYALADPELEL